jgi:hypothetical protein
MASHVAPLRSTYRQPELSAEKHSSSTKNVAQMDTKEGLFAFRDAQCLWKRLRNILGNALLDEEE